MHACALTLLQCINGDLVSTEEAAYPAIISLSTVLYLLKEMANCPCLAWVVVELQPFFWTQWAIWLSVTSPVWGDLPQRNTDVLCSQGSSNCTSWVLVCCCACVPMFVCVCVCMNTHRWISVFNMHKVKHGSWLKKSWDDIAENIIYKSHSSFWRVITTTKKSSI